MTATRAPSTAGLPVPEYAVGCRGGHSFLEVERGVCLLCGRGPEVPHARRLITIPGPKRAAAHSGLPALAVAVEQMQLAMRSLAVLEDIDPLDPAEYPGWLAAAVADHRTVEQRLAVYDEADVRWAIKAAAI